jgi:hypothetical protein
MPSRNDVGVAIAAVARINLFRRESDGGSVRRQHESYGSTEGSTPMSVGPIGQDGGRSTARCSDLSGALRRVGEQSG